MKHIKNSFLFFIYSNLFIAICVVLMVNQTYQLLLHQKVYIYFAGFVFFSTLTSYSFHWYLTSGSVIPSPRIQWLKENKIIHLILFFAGLAGSVFFFFYISSYWVWLSLAVVATFLYSAPKIPHSFFRVLLKIALGKPIFLAFVWMYVTTILPVIISGNDWPPGTVLFSCYRFFQIYTICILFDYRDREDDKAAGIKSLITYLSEKNITYLFAFSLLTAVIAALWMLNYGFPVWHIILLIIPCVITALLYDHARRNFGDIFYYFVLDGLLALSALLMLIAGI